MGNARLEPGHRTGDARELVNIDYMGASVAIGLNATYLLDALGVIDEENVELKLTDESSPCFIQPARDAGFFCIVMPMRINE